MSQFDSSGIRRPFFRVPVLAALGHRFLACRFFAVRLESAYRGHPWQATAEINHRSVDGGTVAVVLGGVPGLGRADHLVHLSRATSGSVDLDPGWAAPPVDLPRWIRRLDASAAAFPARYFRSRDSIGCGALFLHLLPVRGARCRSRNPIRLVFAGRCLLQPGEPADDLIAVATGLAILVLAVSFAVSFRINYWWTYLPVLILIVVVRRRDVPRRRGDCAASARWAPISTRASGSLPS